MTSWMAGWKRRDWKTASGDPVKNKEIWVGLDVAASDHEQVRWHWVKGHIGHALNERADVLAVAATHESRSVGAPLAGRRRHAPVTVEDRQWRRVPPTAIGERSGR